MPGLNATDENEFEDSNFRFLEAVTRGELEKITDHLNNGVQINTRNPHGDTALHLATLIGRLDIVQILLDYGIDVNATNNDGFTAFKLAQNENHYDIVQFLYKGNNAHLDGVPAEQILRTVENSPRKEKTEGSNASFLRAARAGNLEKVLDHLKAGIDIDTSNANGLNALHLASKEGHSAVVNQLLKRGAKVNASTRKGNTGLHIASLAGQLDIVRILVESGADVNVQSQNGFTPLYMAAQENHDGVVTFLLQGGANQSLATEDGFTPLAVALQQGHDKVVALLLENDTRGKVRLPALHIAAKKDDIKAAGLLLQNEHNPDATSKSGFTPLHIASHYGNENVAKLLLEKGANVNFQARHDITPLHVASKWGRGNLVTLLLAHGAVIDCRTRDLLTPLHCAARSGHDQVVDLLLQKGAPVSAMTKNGLSALHMAAQGDHVDTARILLYHRAPVDEVTVDYLTPLHVAAHCGHVRVAKLLLDRSADPNSRALNGFTPLHIACKKNRIKVVELLLKYQASIEATTESGLTPLHVAAFMGGMNIVVYLIQNGANPDVTTVRGETPLHLAARANQTDVIRILLRNGATVDAKAREQQTPLHIASRLGNGDIVMLLRQHGAQVDAATRDNYTPLHIAAKEGQEEVAALLIDQGAPLTVQTKKGFTPLHLAAKYGNMEVAKLLLEKGTPVDVEGKNQVTPLHVASHYNHEKVALLLLEKGASPHAAAKNGYTPLHIASKKNQMDIATTLLEYKADPNCESKAGFTPVHLASQEGHVQMANLLMEHGSQVNSRAKNGLTAMHLCAQEDRTGVAEVLVEKGGAEIDAQTKAGYTPLHVACHFGQINMVEFLLRHGAVIDSVTKMGYTPLHQAAQQGHGIIVKVLLEHGASPNAVTATGQTPLAIAQKLGYVSVVETLRTVTETTVITETTTIMEERYKVQAPETMQETFMSESEDEGEYGSRTALLGAAVSQDLKELLAPSQFDTLRESHAAVGEPNSLYFDSSFHSTSDIWRLSPSQNGGGSSSTFNVPGGAHSISTTLYQSHDLPPLQSALSAQRVAAAPPTRRRKGKMNVSAEDVYITTPDSLRATNESLNERWRVGDYFETTFARRGEAGVGNDSFGDEITKGTHLDQDDLLERDFQGALLPMDKSFETDQAHLETLIRNVQTEHLTGKPPLALQQGYQIDGHYLPDNVDLAKSAIHTGISTSTLASSLSYKSFLISFMVDARGGAMRGCRHSGVRIIVPPRKAPSPVRITCRYLRKEKLLHPPPLSEGEALASRILEMGPSGAKFLGPVILEVPHFASLRNREREIVILRSDDGEHWKEHQLEATEDAIQEVLNESFDPEELSQLEDLNTTRITRILTSDFPQYFSIVTRVRQEVHAVGPEGGIISSTVVPLVQALFPEGALTKIIRVSLQAHVIPQDMINKLFGNRLAVSPIVTVEPRRRKFHKPITLCIPLPQSTQKGMLTQPPPAAGAEPATLRLLCSITGGTAPAQWEDITGTTQLTFTGDSVSFTSTVSARFWLMDCQATREASRMAQEIYGEAIVVPYMAKFVIFARRPHPKEGQLRVFCMTDDKEDKTLERQEHYIEIAKSRDVEVPAHRNSYLEFGGNLLPVLKSGEQLQLNFVPFVENRLMFNMRVREADEEESAAEGRIAFMREPKVRSENLPPQHPICTLAITLPKYTGKSSEFGSQRDMNSLDRKYKHLKIPGLDTISGSNVRAADVARELAHSGSRREEDETWNKLAVELGLPDDDTRQIAREYGGTGQEALTVLRVWLERLGPRATAPLLDKALRRLKRGEVARKLFPELQQQEAQTVESVQITKPITASPATDFRPPPTKVICQEPDILLGFLNKTKDGLEIIEEKRPSVVAPSTHADEHHEKILSQTVHSHSALPSPAERALVQMVTATETTIVRSTGKLQGPEQTKIMTQKLADFPDGMVEMEKTLKPVEISLQPDLISKLEIRPPGQILKGQIVEERLVTSHLVRPGVYEETVKVVQRLEPLSSTLLDDSVPILPLRVTPDNLMEGPLVHEKQQKTGVEHEPLGVVIERHLPSGDDSYVQETSSTVVEEDIGQPTGATTTTSTTTSLTSKGGSKKVKKGKAETDQKQESTEEGFLDEHGNVVISKKITRIVTTTKSMAGGEPQVETARVVDKHGIGHPSSSSSSEFHRE